MERGSELIYALANALWKILADLSKKHGLSPLQGQIAILLAKRGPTPISQIAKELGVSTSTISESLKSMARMGYIQVERGKDKRVKIVKLTERGAETAREITQLHHALDKAISQLNYAEKALLHMLFAKLAGSLIDQGLIETPKVCIGCPYLETKGDTYICKLAERPLGKTTTPTSQ